MEEEPVVQDVVVINEAELDNVKSDLDNYLRQNNRVLGDLDEEILRGFGPGAVVGTPLFALPGTIEALGLWLDDTTENIAGCITGNTTILGVAGCVVNLFAASRAPL